MNARYYNSKYAAPKNQFDLKKMTFEGVERQYYAFRSSQYRAAPDSADKARWSRRADSSEFMKRILSDAKVKYKIGDVPIYGFGHSAGAIMMTLLSVQSADMFNAIAVHAGYIPSKSAIISQNMKRARTPLAHFLGTEDHIFSVEEATKSAQALAENGQTVELNIIPQHNHWYYDIAPFVNSKAWEFLSNHP